MLELTKLYAITDARLTRMSHAQQVVALCSGGATLVQLREKARPPREFYREAKEALRVARDRGARLIINDRVDIAMALGADGVHLGQDDLDPVAARRLLGGDAIIGFSTHNLEQAKEALRMPISYLAVGPIFATSSKENPDPTLGLAELRRIRDATREIPIVAIGGIDATNARETLAAGADCVAVIRALLSPDADECTRLTRQLLELLNPSTSLR
jgi:thiamine-phosphate pyrophosphorylase